jgi:hypothetical protein
MALSVAAPASFFIRLRLAALEPLMLRLSLIAITGAAVYTYLASLLSPVFQAMLDFGAYYHAAADLNNSLDPYLRYDHSVAFSLSAGYIYPPFLAHLLQPFALLPYPKAALLALLILQCAVLISVALTWRLLNLRSWTARVFILDAFLLSATLVVNLQLGQINVILMPLTLAWILAYAKRSPFAWVFVGLNVGLKLQQVPLFALAFFRRDWRALAIGLLTLAATFVFGGLALGFEYFTQVLPRLSSTIPVGDTALVADFEHILHPDFLALTYDPTYPEAKFLFAFIILVVAALTGRALYRLRDRHLEALLALSTVPLLSSYVGAGHLLPLFPVGILLAAYAYRLRKQGLFIVLVIATFLLADFDILYPLLPFFSFLFAPALFFVVTPGLAALTLWLVALRLAAIAKTPSITV